ncbi:CHAT domain-containing protein, partial [Allocoleopsis sp.]|uniref:CHAT domain-containing protein n=1 Tax=Allocoleopsis sp. TaxID=3088169 RepID=UPI002FD22AD2
MLKIKLFTTFLCAPFLLLVSGLINAIPLQAQIPPALDSTGTRMTGLDGSRMLKIQREMLSGDRANLVHSTPQISNSLGQFIGGNPSVINDLIQLRGENSNLFLMNSGGFRFGQGTSLNIPAGFTGNTANGMAFGGRGFNAVGTNNDQVLVGSPNPLAFPMAQPGSLINAGKVSFGEGHSVTVLGGKVINTGTITAPGGDITIATVPGQNRVSLSQPGSPLSLEIATTPGSMDRSLPTAAGLSALDLPKLLTGTGEAGAATKVNGNGVDTQNISVAGGNSSNIDITSIQGNVTTPDIANAAQTGGLSSLDIKAGNPLSTGLPGNGDIKLTSRQGDIRTDSPHPNPGSIRLPRPSINAANVRSSSTLADDKTVTQLEERQNSEFLQYFGNNLSSKPVSAESIQNTLVDIEQKTGNRSAVIYVNLPEENPKESQTGERSDAVKLVVILPGGKAKSVTVSGVERSQLLQTIQDFRGQITTSYRRGNRSYLKSAQQLYQWLIAPIEPQLQEASINTLLFSMENGMRTLPIAAMHDGKQFLVEKYSLGMIPSFGLLDAKYKTLEKANVLAMGASSFETQAPLPAVSTELSVVKQMWQGKVFLNEDFNRFNLVEPRRGNRYQIVHLATHAEFNSGSTDNSYIQLWNDKLRLSEMSKLGWKEAEVDL